VSEKRGTEKGWNSRRLKNTDEARRTERLRNPRHRWGYNTKIDIREIGCSGMNWIYLAQCRDQWMALVNTTMNIRIP
jgi:hypothetical protein